MSRDMGALVRAVVKDMQWNKPVEKIAKKHDFEAASGHKCR